MDNFIVSARKYRPATFDTVVGQQHITSTLQNAIHNQQLAQAFLFCGPRGVGKTTCARILAKTINCEKLTPQTEACGECASCQSFQHGNSFSIHELDAASNNSVDDIRNLIDQVRIPPQTGKYKIYIIDEVHMLSQQAFNAFLKTLEEPPSYAIFILATTEKHKILPTILSRCQIFDFNRIRVEDMAQHLAHIAQVENISFEQDGLHLIAQKADGGLRDALSMFDQIVSFSNNNVSYQAVIDNLNILDYDYYFRLTDALLGEDAASALLLFDEILNNGFDGNHFVGGLASHFRNLLVAKELSTLKLLEVSENVKVKYGQQAAKAEVGILLSSLNIANQCEINYKTSKNQRLQVELALLKMCHIAAAIQLHANGYTAAPVGESQKKKLPEQAVQRPVKGEEKAPAPIASAERTSVEAATVKPALAEPAIVEPIIVEPARVKSGGWGKSKISSNLPNLNTILATAKVEEKSDGPELVYGSVYEQVTTEQLLTAWKRLAENLKTQNRINLYTMMVAFEPRLVQGNIIEVDVENLIQLDVLNSSKIDLLNILRTELRNFSLDIKGVQLNYEVSHKPYTSQEKYQVMASKNPMLEELRKAFNLGLS